MSGAKILIIDGNEKVRWLLEGHLKGRGYEVVGVENGLEAARNMREGLPNLLLIDQDIPMGGIKTARLLRLHATYQQIPILLTVNKQKVGDELIEQGKKLNLDSFVVKPCTGKLLDQKVEENLGRNLEKISVVDMRAEIADLAGLPVLLSSHRKMLQLLSKEDAQVEIPELIRTIQMDQGLTTEILRVCHSAYYGFRGNSIEGATTFLGIGKIRKIVQAAVILDIFKTEKEKTDDDGFSMLELWKHSVGCGLIMEEGGRRGKGRGHFIGGMRHDVGKVILQSRFPEHFAEVRRIVRSEGKSMYQAERELIGVSHTDIGHELAKKWNLPPTIATSIAFHHRPGDTLQHKRLASLVHLSDILARTLEIGHGGDRKKIGINPIAEPLAKYVFAVSKEKEKLLAEVESVVCEGREQSDQESAPKPAAVAE